MSKDIDKTVETDSIAKENELMEKLLMSQAWDKKFRNMFNIKLKPFRRTDKKIRRNDLCPCGSGLKYKKCCIDKKEVTEHSFENEIKNLIKNEQHKINRGH